MQIPHDEPTGATRALAIRADAHVDALLEHTAEECALVHVRMELLARSNGVRMRVEDDMGDVARGASTRGLGVSCDLADRVDGKEHVVLARDAVVLADLFPERVLVELGGEAGDDDRADRVGVRGGFGLGRGRGRWSVARVDRREGSSRSWGSGTLGVPFRADLVRGLEAVGWMSLAPLQHAD